MNAPVTPYRSAQRAAGRDGFPQLLHAEWTKFRTVRGWVVGMTAAALMVVLFAVLAGVSSVQNDASAVPVGPSGEPVTDSFYYVHQPLDGNGSLTVSVSALTDRVPAAHGDNQSEIVPWAKAGLILKDGTRQGSRYVAIMVTSGHGVRMQDNYVNDMAGLPGPASEAAPRWLRLERSGNVVTGYDSVDGTNWITVGTVRDVGLGSATQGGMFLASPPVVRGLGTNGSVATAAFRNLAIQGGQSGGEWTGDQVGAESPTFAGYPPNTSASFTRSGGGFILTGAGDIAPAVRESLPTGGTLGEILTGTFVAVIAVIVVGTLFITTEYRSDLIALTFAASPRRIRVLMAKAIVLGGITFAAGLTGALVAVPIGERLARAHGVFLFPVTASVQFRVELGIAALLATVSILALAVGTVVRRGGGAAATVIVAVVVPYVLLSIPFFPAGVADWLARTTPAAAFAVLQTLVRYHQVTSIYTPYDGYFPLSPWAGLAVLAGYAAASLALAAVLLRRRDV